MQTKSFVCVLFPRPDCLLLLPSIYFRVVSPCLCEPVAGISYQSQPANLVVFPHSSEQFAHVVSGYRVVRIDESSGIERDARQYAFYKLVRLIDRPFLNIHIPDMPGKMFTAGEAQ
jgi:hypothetical protein